MIGDKLGSLAKWTLCFMLSQIIFMISGYAIHIFIGRYLGPDDYGIFGIIISIMTLINILFATGISQASSKFIATENNDIDKIMKISFNLQIIFSIIIFIIYFISSQIIANILGDPDLSKYIRISAFAIPIYAIYSIYGGFLNGLRLYGRQTFMTIAQSIIKVITVIGLVLLGFAIYGAIIGYILGALISAIIGWIYIIDIKNNSIDTDKNSDFSSKKIIDFSLLITVFSFSLLFLINADLFIVKRILDNTQTGYYTAASTLSKLPYYILTGLGITLFPAISKFSSDKIQVKKYIRESIRYLILILFPITVIISGSSKLLIEFIYSNKYIDASYPLETLIFGLAAFTISYILMTIINAYGRPMVPTIITVILIPIVIILNWFLIPIYGLEGAAIATTITGFIGLILSSAYIIKIFGTFIDFISLIRISFASLIIYKMALWIKVDIPIVPLWYMFLFGIYLCILILTKEFNKNDFKIVANIMDDIDNTVRKYIPI